MWPGLYYIIGEPVAVCGGGEEWFGLSVVAMGTCGGLQRCGGCVVSEVRV